MFHLMGSVYRKTIYLAYKHLTNIQYFAFEELNPKKTNLKSARLVIKFALFFYALSCVLLIMYHVYPSDTLAVIVGLLLLCALIVFLIRCLTTDPLFSRNQFENDNISDCRQCNLAALNQ